MLMYRQAIAPVRAGVYCGMAAKCTIMDVKAYLGQED